MEGFEADDLIATYARLAREAGGDTTIISSDKDLMQLVGAHVSHVRPDEGPPDRHPRSHREMGRAAGKDDRPAGADRRLGRQRAGRSRHRAEDGGAAPGNLSATSTRCWRGPARSSRTSAARSIIANADKARISRELVTLKNDVPVTEGLDDFMLQPPDGPKLIGFLKTMEFSTLTRRVAEATGTDAGRDRAVPP